ncbi:MAG: glycerol-3-phosphate 1-O-acyltransferase PlsY [Candidatus Omnitrophica bacterium]|nr:glycerol-3-phosphate 1-O-acyltransferase PlsY [Candidatus Omnitrophota bacterium]
MNYVIFSLLLAYVLGSIPTAYVFGKVLKGIDIREYGSGNVGATNVFRVMGKWPAIIVFIIDFLKGFLAVTLVPLLMQKFFSVINPDRYDYVITFSGVAAIAGHIWTCFLKFKGGKGVATTAGVMIGIAPLIFVGGLIVWTAAFYSWRYVSLASLIAATSLPVFALFSGKGFPFVIFCCALCIVGVYSHRENIKRLIQGKENKFVKGQKS